MTKDKAVTDIKPTGQYSFPRTARLLKPIDFKRVFKTSIASSDRYFKVLARPNGRGFSRLGLAVSRKVDRHAVGRNRIKRVVRESFRHAFESGATSPVMGDGTARPPNGIDLVVLPRPVCATICNGQLMKSLDDHWSRLKKSSSRDPAWAEAGSSAPVSGAANETAGRT